MKLGNSNNTLFSADSQRKKIKLRHFTVILLAVLIIGGSLSAFIFMKHYNFNLQSAFGEGTTAERSLETESETGSVKADTEDFTLLLFCVDSERTKLSLLSLARFGFDSDSISFCSLSPDKSADFNGSTMSLAEIYNAGGAEALTDAVKSVTGVRADRYLGSTENQFKMIVNHFGGFNIIMDKTVEYRGSDFTLILPKGAQLMKGETLHRYFRYLATLGPEGFMKQSELLGLMFKTELVPEGTESMTADFSYLANHLITNTSIIDFSQVSPGIESLMLSDATSYSAVASPEALTSDT